jgi:hypothetical protein
MANGSSAGRIGVRRFTIMSIIEQIFRSRGWGMGLCIVSLLGILAAGCVSAVRWAQFDEAVSNAHVVFLCDVAVETNDVTFVVRQAWRKSPEILDAFAEGDELALTCLDSLRNSGFVDRKRSRQQAFLFLTDIQRVVPSGIDPPLKPEEAFGWFCIWGWDGSFAGNIEMEKAVLRIESELQD